MMELHRNTKIWLLIIGICVVAIIFFRELAIGFIVITAIVGGIIYMFYKGIRTKIEEFGRGELKLNKNKGAYKKRIAKHPYPKTPHRIMKAYYKKTGRLF